MEHISQLLLKFIDDGYETSFELDEGMLWASSHPDKTYPISKVPFRVVPDHPCNQNIYTVETSDGTKGTVVIPWIHFHEDF